MASNADENISTTNSEEIYREKEAQEPKILENDRNNLSAVLKRATSQANAGNWDAVIADAITAREMDPRSQDAWKLCARAELARNDVDAALDCLHEALHIDHMDREACETLKRIVADHFNKAIEGKERVDCMWNWWNETNDDEITHGPDKIGTGSLEDKLLGCIQIGLI